MAVRGWATGCKWVNQGSSLAADAAIDDTVLQVSKLVDFDDQGGTLLLNEAELEYVTVDTDAETITLAAPLVAAAAVGDRVDVVTGGQVGKDYTLFVSIGEGPEAEVDIPFGDRDAWPEGDYDDPVEVELSNDLEKVERVLGVGPRRRIVAGYFATAEDGQRLEITGDEPGGGFLRFFTGNGEETWPGFIQIDDYGVDGDHASGYVAIKSPSFRYQDEASLSLISATADGSYGLARARIDAAIIELTGDLWYLTLGMYLDANGKDIRDVADLDAASVKIGGGTKVNVLAAGEGSVDTNGSGIGTFTHGLSISGPYTVQITPRNNANARLFTTTEKNANNFKVRVDNDAGSPVASVTGITFDYLILG